MFPLVHYFVNKQIYASDSKLMILGGLWPDLASGAGFDRNRAHEMGEDFYQWCLRNAPEGLPLARGIIGHGIQPFCVDYYADEHWQDGPKGWCFQLGKKYEQAVGEATGLGSDYSWWKSHNFIEICCELLTNEQIPGLGEEILAAIRDTAAKEEAARLLSAYSGCDPAAIIRIFTRVTDIFALDDLSPMNLAQKQAVSIAARLNLKQHNCDIPAMADLMEKMRDEIRPEYAPFMEALIRLCGPVMSRY